MRRERSRSGCASLIPTSSTRSPSRPPSPCRPPRRCAMSTPGLPGTGPYRVESAEEAKVVLTRNPRFGEHSTAAQPQTYPDRIEVQLGPDENAQLRAGRAGRGRRRLRCLVRGPEEARGASDAASQPGLRASDDGDRVGVPQHEAGTVRRRSRPPSRELRGRPAGDPAQRTGRAADLPDPAAGHPRLPALLPVPPRSPASPPSHRRRGGQGCRGGALVGRGRPHEAAHAGASGGRCAMPACALASSSRVWRTTSTMPTRSACRRDGSPGSLDYPSPTNIFVPLLSCGQSENAGRFCDRVAGGRWAGAPAALQTTDQPAAGGDVGAARPDRPPIKRRGSRWRTSRARRSSASGSGTSSTTRSGVCCWISCGCDEFLTVWRSLLA